MDPSTSNIWLSLGIPSWLPYLLEWLAGIGGISFIAYGSTCLYKWAKSNYLSEEEKVILREMLWNNHRILFKPERSDYPLHIKITRGDKPYPSEDRLEMMKYYEKFERLVEKGFVRHGVDEIYILTSRGIRAANKQEEKPVQDYLKSQ